MTTHNLLMKYKDLCSKYPNQRDTFYQIINEVLSEIDTKGESINLIKSGIKKLEKSSKNA